MELALNMVWAVLATVMIRLWMRHARRERENRWTQPVALAMSLVVLFPAISLTDDLLAIQNPAIADVFVYCTRRDHAVACSHSDFAAAAALPAPVHSELSFGLLRGTRPFNLQISTVDNPALASIQNRPPPAV
jgi:hypothetical protein